MVTGPIVLPALCVDELRVIRILLATEIATDAAHPLRPTLEKVDAALGCADAQIRCADAHICPQTRPGVVESNHDRPGADPFDGLTIAEVADRVGYTGGHIRRLASTGAIPAWKDPHGMWRMKPADVADALERT